MTEHSPTPWRFGTPEIELDDCENGYVSQTIVADGCALPIAITYGLLDQEGRGPSEVAHDANAALIVRCVNSHDALVAALEAVMAQPTENPLRLNPDERKKMWAAHEQARSALRAARGQSDE